MPAHIRRGQEPDGMIAGRDMAIQTPDHATGEASHDLEGKQNGQSVRRPTLLLSTWLKRPQSWRRAVTSHEVRQALISLALSGSAGCASKAHLAARAENSTPC